VSVYRCPAPPCDDDPPAPAPPDELEGDVVLVGRARRHAAPSPAELKMIGLLSLALLLLSLASSIVIFARAH
jgi:hypothetical protein